MKRSTKTEKFAILVWYNEPGIGFSGQGTAYIEQVFRWAHKADPKALLFYNEAEGEGLNRKSDAIYALIKEFKRHGVPIDGVGLQMHVPMLDADIPATRRQHSTTRRARPAGSHHRTRRIPAVGFHCGREG